MPELSTLGPILAPAYEGEADTLLRKSLLDRVAAPVLVAGQYIDNVQTASAMGTIPGIADCMDLVEFFPPLSFSIDRIGTQVTGAVASSEIKLVVYSADPLTGAPKDLLLETAPLSSATAGLKEATVSLSFTRGEKYWYGLRQSHNATVRAVPLTGSRSLGYLTSTQTSYPSFLRSSVPFASAAPSVYTYDISQLTQNSNGSPNIRMRVA